MPTIQSATARLITKQLVTVRSRRVVMTDKIIRVLPNTVIMITVVKKTSRQVCWNDKDAKVCGGGGVSVVVVVALVAIISDTFQWWRIAAVVVVVEED